MHGFLRVGKPVSGSGTRGHTSPVARNPLAMGGWLSEAQSCQGMSFRLNQPIYAARRFGGFCMCVFLSAAPLTHALHCAPDEPAAKTGGVNKIV
jgi:hypothetical protein